MKVTFCWKRLLVIGASVFPLILSAGEATDATITEFLEITRFDAVMDEMIECTVQGIMAEDPELGCYEAELRAFFDTCMKGEKVRKEIASLYADFFSEEELRDLIAFYGTKTGQKALTVASDMLARIMPFIETYIEQHQDDLVEALQNAAGC